MGHAVSRESFVSRSFVLTGPSVNFDDRRNLSSQVVNKSNSVVDRASSGPQLGASRHLLVSKLIEVAGPRSALVLGVRFASVVKQLVHVASHCQFLFAAGVRIG